jgi:hypothetical protein
VGQRQQSENKRLDLARIRIFYYFPSHISRRVKQGRGKRPDKG